MMQRSHLQSLAGVGIDAAGDAGVEGVQNDTLHVCVREVEQVIQALVPACKSGTGSDARLGWWGICIDVAFTQHMNMLPVYAHSSS